MRTISGVLVVYEGLARLRWRHELDGRSLPPARATDWELAGVWPDPESARDARHRVYEDHPVLIVLDHEPAVVSLLSENVPTVPRGLVLEDGDDDLMTVRVPELDWLPPDLHSYGLRFALETRARLASLPRHRRPQIVLDEPAAHDRSVRFAHSTGVSPVEQLLEPILDELFGSWSGPVFVPWSESERISGVQRTS